MVISISEMDCIEIAFYDNARSGYGEFDCGCYSDNVTVIINMGSIRMALVE